MKCQSLFTGKYMKNIINLMSAELSPENDKVFTLFDQKIEQIYWTIF